MRFLSRQVLTTALAAAAGAGGTAAGVVTLRGEGVTYQAYPVSTPDSVCIAVGNANADTLGLLHTGSGAKRQTGAQKRARQRLVDLFIAQCLHIRVGVDTIPDDSLPPPPSDTTTTPPPDTLPAPPDTTTPPDTATPPDTVVVPPPPVDTLPPPVVTDSTGLAILTLNIGPTLTQAQAIAAGRGLMDSLFTKWEPYRWSLDGSQWAGNYYDRALIYYEMCARHPNPLYCVRGDAIALDYRRNYLHKSNYQTSPHWAQLDGVAMHFWRTGDDSSRIAVGKAAWNLTAQAITWPRDGNYTDARQQARSLIAALLAWQMNAPNAPAGGWAATIDRGLDAILPQQSADGAWRYPVNTCDLSLNYMGAMLADALMRVHDTYRPDPRIPVAIKKTADFLWTQWRANDAVPSFNYYEALCQNQHGTGGPTATPDLTGLFTTTFAWMAKHDPAYRAKADAVFAAAMKGLYPQGSKQFNQAFAFSWRALGYLP